MDEAREGEEVREEEVWLLFFVPSLFILAVIIPLCSTSTSHTIDRPHPRRTDESRHFLVVGAVIRERRKRSSSSSSPPSACSHVAPTDDPHVLRSRHLLLLHRHPRSPRLPSSRRHVSSSLPPPRLPLTSRVQISQRTQDKTRVHSGGRRDAL